MTRRLLIVLCLVISGVGMSSMASAATGPRGSVILKSSALLKVGSTQCGKVNGSWISGKVTKIKSKNYFVSYSKSSQLYVSDARKSQGLKRKTFLKLGSDYKVKASRGDKKCSRYNGSMPITTTVPVVTTVPVSTTTPVTSTVASSSPALKFDVASSVALALVDSSVSASGVNKRGEGSNLKSFDSTGKVKDALVSGQANIKRFLIAPNDKLYVEFATRTQVGKSMQCLLAEVDRSNGGAICIEDDVLTEIQAGSRDSDEYWVLRNDFQFDEKGSIYYMVRVQQKLNSHYVGAAQFVRRVSGGVKYDFGLGKWEHRCFVSNCPDVSTPWLLNPIWNFLVLSDGSLYIEQQIDDLTKGVSSPAIDEISTNSTFSLDLYRPDGSKIAVDFYPTNPRRSRMNAMKQVSGNLLLVAIDRYVRPTSSVIDPKADENPNDGWYEVSLRNDSQSKQAFLGSRSQSPKFTTQGLGCDDSPEIRGSAPRGDGTSEEDQFDNIVCLNRADVWRDFWVSPNGSAYVFTGFGLVPAFCHHFKNYSNCVGKGAIIKAWPTIGAIKLSGLFSSNPVFTNITSATHILGSVVANGVTTLGKFSTVLYGLDDDVSRELIGANENVLISKMSYSSICNCLVFAGSRGYGGAALYGTVNLGTSRIAIVESNLKFSDLQSFAK